MREEMREQKEMLTGRENGENPETEASPQWGERAQRKKKKNEQNEKSGEEKRVHTRKRGKARDDRFRFVYSMLSSQCCQIFCSALLSPPNLIFFAFRARISG